MSLRALCSKQREGPPSCWSCGFVRDEGDSHELGQRMAVDSDLVPLLQAPPAQLKLRPTKNHFLNRRCFCELGKASYVCEGEELDI